MKRGVFLVVILVAAAALAPAQQFVAPWGPPVPGVEEGATLWAVGFWADAVGLGLMAGAGPAFSLSYEAGMSLFTLGLSSMLFVGNPCAQIGLTRHHDALVERGYDVPMENRNKSRLLSRIALGLGGGSAALGIVSAVTDSTGLGIGAIVVGGAGAIVEIVNFYLFRLNWVKDMKLAAGLQVP